MSKESNAKPPQVNKTIAQNNPDGSSMRYGRIEDMDRSFDLDFWQKLGTEAIFKAAWELAKDYHRKQGMTEDEFRFQRSFSDFKRMPS